MTDEVKTKKKPLHVDRVNLSPKAYQRLSRWMEQINETLKGANVSRHNLASWLIESRFDDLSMKEIAEIRKQFYNEENLVKWALREQKQALQRGESLSIVDLIKSQSVAPKVEKRPSTKKAKSVAESAGTEGPTTDLKSSKIDKDDYK